MKADDKHAVIGLIEELFEFLYGEVSLIAKKDMELIRAFIQAKSSRLSIEGSLEGQED